MICLLDQTLQQFEFILRTFPSWWWGSSFLICHPFCSTSLKLNSLKVSGRAAWSKLGYGLGYGLDLEVYHIKIHQIFNHKKGGLPRLRYLWNCKFTNIRCGRFDTILRSIRFTVKFWRVLYWKGAQNLTRPLEATHLRTFTKRFRVLSFGLNFV